MSVGTPVARGPVVHSQAVDAATATLTDTAVRTLPAVASAVIPRIGPLCGPDDRDHILRPGSLARALWTVPNGPISAGRGAPA
jgi:hypothetical protein